MPVQTRSSLCQKRKAVEDGAVRREHCTIDDQCAICHETLHSSQVYHLPCGHSFHTGCIERQLQAGSEWSNLCALCRTDHEQAFSCVPALESIQNNNFQRRVRRRIGFIDIDLGNGRHAVGYAVSNDIGGEIPPFIMYGDEDGLHVAVPRMEPAPEAHEDDAAAGPLDEPAGEPIAAEAADMEIEVDETRSSTPASLPPLIPAETIDEDDWPLLDEDEEDMIINTLPEENDDPDSREIDYPEEEDTESEEEGIHLYNTYVPYPRGFYRFSNRPGERR